MRKDGKNMRNNTAMSWLIIYVQGRI